MQRGSAVFHSSSNPYKHLLPASGPAQKRPPPFVELSLERKRRRAQSISKQREDERQQRGLTLWCARCGLEVLLHNDQEVKCPQCCATRLDAHPQSHHGKRTLTAR